MNKYNPDEKVEGGKLTKIGRAFSYLQSPADPNLLQSADKTLYHREKNGQLIRLTPKKGERKK